MGLAESYNHYIYEKSDPRVASWPLMGSPVKIISVAIIYLFLIKKVGPALMHGRKPLDLKQILRVYNVIQVASCCYLIYGFMKYGWWNKYSVVGCHPVDYSDAYEAVEETKLFWWTLMLKICELIETVFFVLRKKDNQISKLHLYHHASTMLFAWLGAKYMPGGNIGFYIIINCFVHVLMYSYYLASTFGPTWQKVLRPWKPKLTMIQMIQFVIALLYSAWLMRPSCIIPKIGATIFVPNILLIFYMFYDFYRKNYTKKPKQT